MNYKFEVGDKTTIVSYIGIEVDVVIFSRYRCDNENHPAHNRHNRYVCYDSSLKSPPRNLHDVSEQELQWRVETIQDRMEEQGLAPWSEDGSKWIVTHLSRSAEGVSDAQFDSYEEAYEFARGLVK